MKNNFRYSRAASTACCGCLVASFIPTSIALADWEALPDVRMGVEANDNPRLGQSREGREADPEAFDDHTSTRMLMDAAVRLRNAGPRGEVMFRPRARVDTYADEVDEELEREDLYLNARARYEWTRVAAGVRANLGRESILSAELGDTYLDEDPADDPIDTDTGQLVLLDEVRNRAIFAPYANFELSERSTLITEARHVDVSYTGPQLPSRSDFTDSSFALGVGRTIDGRTGAAARFVVSRFEAEATSNETDTIGVEGTFNRQLNEFWSFNLTTGLQRSEFTFVDEEGAPVDNAATNYTFEISFRKQTELSTLSLGIFRRLNPNAVGFLVERNEFRTNYRRRLSERLSAGVGFRYLDSGPLDRPGQDREYARADFDVEWAFTPSWALSVAYGAVDQELSGVRPDGSANLLSVGAVYRGLSRGGD